MKRLLLPPSPGAPPMLAESKGEIPSSTFTVQNVTGMFSRHEQLCIGMRGMSPWCVVFQRDDEQRILDCSRILDVKKATPSEQHFTIKFGPRVKLETFQCDDMERCVDALHHLLWKFSQMHNYHLVKHREAIAARRKDVARLFTKLSSSWYLASLQSATPPAKPVASQAESPPPSPSPSRLNLWDLPECHSELLTPERLGMLHADLPRKLKTRKMQLLFCTADHGFSLATLYRQCKDMGPCILVVKDNTGSICGGFASEFWRPEKGFFGTGESFVFSYHPNDIYQSFGWQGASSNNFFCFADTKGLAMGGGGSGYAFWIDSAIKFGSSHQSDTFKNSQLTAEPEFLCVSLEVWGFDLPQRRRKVYA